MRIGNLMMATFGRGYASSPPSGVASVIGIWGSYWS
jgi:hypothetical protein